MRGMVLAAGLGTRLRPLSFDLPKPIVPVLGRPLCSYTLEFLLRSGVREFLLNLHTKPKLIQQHVTGWAGKRTPVRYTFEPVILGTGGGLRNAMEFLKGGTFVVANGDTVVRFPFASALAFHRKKRALATLVLFPDPSKRYTPVWTDGEGRITGFGSDATEGTSPGFYTGCQIVEPELLIRIPPGKPSCIIRETYSPLAREGAPVYGFHSDGTFLEFGSPAEYLHGTLALLRERSPGGSPAPPQGTGPDIRPPVFLSPGARVAPGARIGPDAVIEEEAVVGEGATVSRAILWPRAVLPPGETLKDAILTPTRRVPVPPDPPSPR